MMDLFQKQEKLKIEIWQISFPKEVNVFQNTPFKDVRIL